MYYSSIIRKFLVVTLSTQVPCSASDQEEKKPFSFQFSPSFLQTLSSPSDKEKKDNNPFAFTSQALPAPQSNQITLQPLLTSLFDDFEQAYKYFQNASNTVEEEVGRQIIRNIVKQELHPYRYKGLKVLLESSDKYDNALSKELLFRNLLTPYSKQYHEKAADVLFNASKTTLEEQLIGARVMIKNNAHEKRFFAAEKLFLAKKTIKDTEKALSVFREIVGDSRFHKDSFPAALILEAQSEQDKMVALASFRKVVNLVPAHHNKFEATERLDLNNLEQDKALVLAAYNDIAQSSTWDHSKRVKAADRLYSSNNEDYKITALNYYISIFQEYSQDLKPDLYKKLLKSSLPAHVAFARQEILADNFKRSYNLLFSYGNDNDRNLTRQRLYSLVEMWNATIQGPKAAYALLKYGDTKDKQYIIDLAQKGNTFAQEAINRLKKG